MPISPSISIGASAARAGGGRWRCSCVDSSGRLAGGPASLTLSDGVRSRRQTRADSSTSQRKQLPDQPGVYLFADARRQGDLRRQGDVDPQAGRRPLLGQVDAAGWSSSSRSRRSTSWSPRPRPRRCSPSSSSSSATGRVFNIRLRDDKSYPYIGISLDEEFPRVYFTRERHRSGAGLLRPLLVSAKRVRETLDLLGQAVPVPHLRGAGAGAALGRALPRLLHQALRRRPASATSTARSTGARSTRSSTSSPAATATSSATWSARWPRRPATRSSSAPRSTATASRRCAR